MFFDRSTNKLDYLAYKRTTNLVWLIQSNTSIKYKSIESIKNMVACLYYKSSLNYIDFFFASNNYTTSLHAVNINNYTFPYDSMKKCYPKTSNPSFYLIIVWKSKIQF